MHAEPGRLAGASFRRAMFAVARYCLRQAAGAAGRSRVGKAAGRSDVAYNLTSGLHDRVIAGNAGRELLTLNG